MSRNENKDIFENVKKNFGFGCMRLPMKDGEVDTEEFSRMVDTFLDNEFNYFDTAHGPPSLPLYLIMRLRQSRLQGLFLRL